ncbi:MAG: hypothetical protein ACI4A8_01835 [Muribaculaceae bacterium]
MRKNYFFSVLLMLCMTAFVAKADYTVKVNIDDASRVALQVSYVDQEIQTGENTFTVGEYGSINITATDGNFLKSVTRKVEDTETSEYISSLTRCNVYISADCEINVTSVNADEMRTGSITVTVDKAENVQLMRGYTYTYVTLNDGENVVKFIPNQENQMQLLSTNSKPFYKVTKNGETEITASGSYYYLDVTDGDTYEVTTEFPDVDVPVLFTYANEESRGAITGVVVNENALEELADSISVKAGSSLSIYFDASNYKVNSFKENNNSPYVSSSYTTTITDTTTFYLDAQKYATFKGTLVLDNPDNVTVYRGQSYNRDIITGLVAGENEIEVSETNKSIAIQASSGCYITSVTDNMNVDGEGNPIAYTADYNGCYNVEVKDGIVITVVSGAIDRNQTAIVYVDDKSAAVHYFSFIRTDRSEVSIETGYNEVKFYDGDNPFQFGWYGSPVNNIFQNGVAVEPQYSGGSTYVVTLADGDVVKLYLAANPVNYNVTFTATEDALSKVDVIRDRIVAVTNPAEGFSVTNGTEVAIVPNDTEAELTISVNDTEIGVGEDGNYTFIVNADSNVAISLPSTGIEGVNVDAQANGNVYNTQGVLVMKNADAAKVNSLPAGIYLMNGKKIVVRK